MGSGLLKLLAFLQKYRTPLIITSCGGVFAANMVSHVFPEQSYRQLYQAWYKGEQVLLSEKLQALLQQVLKDYGVGSPQNFSAFASFGFHPVAAGVPWLPAGALIGIPANFNSTADDLGGITNRSIFINGETVDWTSEAGSTLKDSLVFSEEAQKFAIARDVARLQCGAPVLNAAVAPLCLGGVWIYSAILKQMFGLHGRPLIVRGAVNALSLCLGAASYIISMEAVSNWIDHTSDRRAAQVSQDYAKGGLEFYDKILSRNKTLRSLMGEKGKEVYAPSGNLFPGYVFQFRHTPYTSRRKGILDLLNEEKS